MKLSIKDSKLNSQSFLDEPSVSSKKLVADVSRDWGWLAVGGTLFVALGVWAWVEPFSATLGVVLAYGLILVVGGAIGLAQAFRLSRFGKSGWRIFQSLLSIVGGVLILKYPAIGVLGLSLVICFYLFMSAAAQLTMAFETRVLKGSGWLIFSSILSFVLGAVLLAEMPVSAFYMPGIFLAVDLICNGVTLTIIAFELRKLHKELPQPELTHEAA